MGAESICEYDQVKPGDEVRVEYNVHVMSDERRSLDGQDEQDEVIMSTSGISSEVEKDSVQIDSEVSFKMI